MDTATASKVVLISGGIMAVWVLVTPNEQTATFKRLWGIGALTLALGIMADFVPQIAGPFALLVLVAGGTKNSGKIGKTIDSATGKG